VFGIVRNRLAITASRIGKDRHKSHAGSHAEEAADSTIANHKTSARAGPRGSRRIPTGRFAHLRGRRLSFCAARRYFPHHAIDVAHQGPRPPRSHRGSSRKEIAMKLVRFGNRGQERPGIVTADGRIKDVSAHVRDYDHAFFSSGGLEALRAIAASPESLPDAPARVRIGAPPAECLCDRPQLFRPCQGDGRSGSRRADPLHEVDRSRLRPARSDPDSAGQREDRLGGGTRPRDQPRCPVSPVGSQRSVCEPA
jgi:hypothetical protein